MSSKPKIAVVLSGCGVYDGAEIHESVLTLLGIDKQGGAYQCFAPDVPQHHVVNHLTGDEAQETRNVLVESARIARGAVKDLKQYKAADFDALILPGGFGAAKNLCDFAFKGPECTVQPEVARALKETHAAKKPIGALCIAPAIIARTFAGAQVTIGSDAATAAALEKMGAKHHTTGHGEIHVDQANKIVTTPCYMLEASISQIAEGADKVAHKVIELTR